jgi:hypothetical protein
MSDLKSPALIYAKGFLFLFAGCIAAALLLLEHPTLKAAALLGLAVWSFCRFYYFAFYVIEHYVDPGYKFAGLGSFGLYLLRPARGRPKAAALRTENR